MKTCEIFLLVLLAALLDIFSCKCVASKVCPVRAVPVVAPEGVKCVCGHDYFGKNCRFKGQNVLALDAGWVSVDQAQVTWRTGDEFIHVFTRRVQFDDASGVPSYAKWRAGVRVFNEGEVGNEAKYRDVVTSKEMVHTAPSTNAQIFIRLNSAFSYEIRLVSSDNKNKSSSVFLDGQLSQALALQSNTKSSNSSGEDECSQWYSCPERWLSSILTFFKDFKKPCFKTGVVIGVVFGIIATVLLSALTYAAIRLCTHCFTKKKMAEMEMTVSAEAKTKVCLKSSFSAPELWKVSCSKDALDVTRSKSFAGSVTIDIPSLTESNVDIQPDDTTQSKSARSVVISMPEDGELSSDVRDVGSVSIL